MTRAQIAEAVETKQTTLSDLAIGRSKSPRFDTGMKLLQLHAAHVTADPSSRRITAANEGDAASETDGTSAPLKAA